MKIEQTPLKDSFILTPTIFNDERGTFNETFNEVLFEKVSGQKVNFVQDNQSTSRFGVLRGMHYQVGKMAQAKLVRAIEGRVLDIIVDIRKGSETFGKHFSIILDDILRNNCLFLADLLTDLSHYLQLLNLLINVIIFTIKIQNEESFITTYLFNWIGISQMINLSYQKKT